jgi:hypothetical protein
MSVSSVQLAEFKRYDCNHSEEHPNDPKARDNLGFMKPNLLIVVM